MPSSMTRPVGSQVFVGKGLVAGALPTAEEIGAEAREVAGDR